MLSVLFHSIVADEKSNWLGSKLPVTDLTERSHYDKGSVRCRRGMKTYAVFKEDELAPVYSISAGLDY